MDHNSYYTFLQFWALNSRIVERILRIDVIVESEVNSRLQPYHTILCFSTSLSHPSALV